jgi:hypothetical protein
MVMGNSSFRVVWNCYDTTQQEELAITTTHGSIDEGIVWFTDGSAAILKHLMMTVSVET